MLRDISTSGSTRDAILDATNHALSTVGYKKMKIEDLARAVGIGKGTIYLHFNSKEDIVLAHIDRVASRIQTKMLEIEGSDLSAAERIELVLRTRVMVRFDIVSKYPKGLNEMLSVVRDRLVEKRQLYLAAEAEILSRLIAVGVSNGEFTIANTRGAGTALVDATNALLPFNLSAKEVGDRNEVESRLAAITKVLIDGLRYRCQ